VDGRGLDNRAAQTGVFDSNILISNRLFIDVCTSCAAETGLNSRNVEKRINAVWAPIMFEQDRRAKAWRA
jgi:hypothetical protein